MKRKLISMLMIGMMTFSMVACGDKDKETSADSSTDTVVEENENDETEAEDEEALEDDEEDEETDSNVKKTPMTEEQKFEHNKKVSKELLEFFKQNNTKYKIVKDKEDGSEFWVNFTQILNDSSITGEYVYQKGVILQGTIFVGYNNDKAHKGTAVVDIDKTIVPKLYDIITGTSGKSYAKDKEDLNKVANNTLNDNPDENIPTTFEEHIETEKFGELIRITEGASNVDIIVSAD